MHSSKWTFSIAAVILGFGLLVFTISLTANRRTLVSLATAYAQDSASTDSGSTPWGPRGKNIIDFCGPDINGVTFIGLPTGFPTFTTVDGRVIQTSRTDTSWLKDFRETTMARYKFDRLTAELVGKGIGFVPTPEAFKASLGETMDFPGQAEVFVRAGPDYVAAYTYDLKYDPNTGAKTGSILGVRIISNYIYSALQDKGAEVYGEKAVTDQIANHTEGKVQVNSPTSFVEDEGSLGGFDFGFSDVPPNAFTPLMGYGRARAVGAARDATDFFPPGFWANPDVKPMTVYLYAKRPEIYAQMGAAGFLAPEKLDENGQVLIPGYVWANADPSWGSDTIRDTIVHEIGHYYDNLIFPKKEQWCQLVYETTNCDFQYLGKSGLDAIQNKLGGDSPPLPPPGFAEQCGYGYRGGAYEDMACTLEVMASDPASVEEQMKTDSVLKTKVLLVRYGICNVSKISTSDGSCDAFWQSKLSAKK